MAMLRVVPRQAAVLGRQSGLVGRRAFHPAPASYALSKFAMPAMSPTMTEGGIASWRKKEGETFAPGDVLLEIETDKATMDVEAQDEGVLAKILTSDGAKNVKVGSTIAIFGEEGDDLNSGELSQLASEAQSSPPKEETKKEESPKEDKPSPPPASPPKQDTTPELQTKEEPSKPRDIIFASPIAKRLALEKGIPLAQIKGSGPNGRIIKEDVDSFKAPATTSSTASSSVGTPSGVPAPAPGAAYTDIPLSNMRRTIASRLQESKSSTPHYYVTGEIRMDRLLQLREAFNSAAKTAGEGKSNEGVKGDVKLSVNDFIVKAAGLALTDVPEVNSGWHGDFVRQYHNADICVAVATPTGLITPIVPNVNGKGLASISSLTKSLAKKARDGKLQPSEYQGGSFTVSNLGMYGSVDHFTAIINPPQSCILAIGGTEKKVVEDPTSEKGFKSINVMKVTMSCDHRVVDGAVGARWMKHFKDYMENPLSFML